MLWERLGKDKYVSKKEFADCRDSGGLSSNCSEAVYNLTLNYFQRYIKFNTFANSGKKYIKMFQKLEKLLIALIN